MLAAKQELERAVQSLQSDVARHDSIKARALAEVASLVAERDRLRAENSAQSHMLASLEDNARIPALSASELAKLSDAALATISAEAAALTASVFREDGRRATLTATSPTNECVICNERPLQVAFGCGHFCACEVCATGLWKCIWRAPVTEQRRIYPS